MLTGREVIERIRMRERARKLRVWDEWNAAFHEVKQKEKIKREAEEIEKHKIQMDYMQALAETADLIRREELEQWRKCQDLGHLVISAKKWIAQWFKAPSPDS